MCAERERHVKRERERHMCEERERHEKRERERSSTDMKSKRDQKRKSVIIVIFIGQNVFELKSPVTFFCK